MADTATELKPLTATVSNVSPFPGPAAISGDLQSLLKQAIDPTELKQYVKQREGITGQEKSALESGIESRNAGIAQLRNAMAQSPTLPPLQRMPHAPDQQLTDSINVFGSVAPWLAIFGSLLTRAPLTTAMNSAAAAMQGFTKGQAAQIKLNFNKWKSATTEALDNNSAMLNEYQAARDKYGDKIDELKGELSAIAANNKDRLAMTALDQGNLDAFFELNQKRLDAGIKIATSLATINAKMMAPHGAVQFIQTTDPKDPSKTTWLPAQQDTMGNWHTADANRSPIETPILNIQKAPPSLTPDAKKVAAATYLATGTLPPMGMGASQDRQDILNEAATMAKQQGLSVQDILSGRVSYKADQTSLSNLQKQADSAQSFEQTMVKNIQIVQSLMDKGAGTSDGPIVNRWLQAGKIATGDPDVKAFNAAIVTVMDEYAKILSGATGAQGATDASRAQTEAMLSQWDSPQAIIATINQTILPDSANRISSYQQQLNTIRSRVGSTTSGNFTGSPSKFVNGQIYQDAQGHKAKYQDGQWLPQ